MKPLTIIIFILYLLLESAISQFSRSPQRNGFQGGFQDDSFNVWVRRGNNRNRGGMPTEVIKLRPLSSALFQAGNITITIPNGIFVRMWVIRAPWAWITLGCELDFFPGSNCNFASLTIGSTKYCEGPRIGPLSAQNSLRVVFETRGDLSNFTCAVSSSNADTDSDWSYYGANGPRRWFQQFPFCGGSKQSPINIIPSDTVGQFPWKLLGLHGYDETPSSMALRNGGKFVILRSRSQPYIMGGNLPLNQKYFLDSVIFHWGPTDYAGSEHLINGRSYAGELHLVHYNRKYGRYAEAVNRDDGVAVLSVFLDISRNDNVNLDPIVLGLRNIRNSGLSTDIIPFPVINLLPVNYNDFYRYEGSMTFPPCTEEIIWSVVKEPISISSRQLDEFRLLEDPEGYRINKNIRPVQDIRGRKVQSGQITPTWSHWGPDGQDVWASKISSSCGGRKQSPVNIVNTDSRIQTNWLPIVFRNFDVNPRTITMQNNDNGVQITPTMEELPIIEGGPFPRPYTFLHFHIHWGSRNSGGSEHTVDGRRFIGEIHILFYDASRGSFRDALEFNQGVYEVGIFLRESNVDNPKLQSIFNGLGSIIASQSTTELEPFPMRNLLPENIEDFYTYDGSLTAPTPTCNENAYFLIFRDEVPVSRKQMENFFNLQNAAGFKIINNFRNVQPINQRTVYMTPLGSENRLS